MIARNPAVHGGDIEAVAREHDIAIDELLDFSSNINPAGAPHAARQRLMRDAADAGVLMRYPDEECGELRRAISRYAGVPERLIVIANGAAALIDATVRALAMSMRERTDAPEEVRCIVPVPAFSEYGRAIHAAGGTLLPLSLKPADNFQIDAGALCRALTRERAQLLIITNPHNPSGALASHDALDRIIDHAKTTDTTVLLDEAFIDYAPRASLTPRIEKYANLVILRSLTKFFAMPALRVGYALASSHGLLASVRAQIPSWSVTTLAANAAAAALGDETYARISIASNDARRENLSQSLSALGWRVCPSAANFLLLEASHGALPIGELRARLIREHRIIVRDCSSYEGLPRNRFMRVAVRDEANNARLVEALRSCL